MICRSSDPVCELELFLYENMPILDAYRLHEDGYAIIVSDGKVRVEDDV